MRPRVWIFVRICRRCRVPLPLSAFKALSSAARCHPRPTCRRWSRANSRCREQGPRGAFVVVRVAELVAKLAENRAEGLPPRLGHAVVGGCAGVAAGAPAVPRVTKVALSGGKLPASNSLPERFETRAVSQIRGLPEGQRGAGTGFTPSLRGFPLSEQGIDPSVPFCRAGRVCVS